MFLISFIEAMFFHTRWYHYPIIILLAPLSLIYGMLMFVRRAVSTKKDFGLPIISIGNLIVGGAGKTPFVIALASEYEDVTILSRGYGRKSKGLIEVSIKGKILCNVDTSGDEAMLIAQALPKASVIVCENREEGIAYAKAQGTKIVFLDDAFSRVSIKKYEILLEPEHIYNYLPFPSGAFREFAFASRHADIVVKENKDFRREVRFENLTSKMLLVTAISNPKRLEAFLPEGIVEKVILPDHAYFNEEILRAKMNDTEATSLLVTQKDRVKMKDFKLTLSLMKLELHINKEICDAVNTYIKGFPNEK